MTFFYELERCMLSGTVLEDAGIHAISMARLDELGKMTSHVVPKKSGNAETVFQAGSISKAITALGVARLVDRGLVSLDSRVVDHLPASVRQALGLTDPCIDAVTIESLLSHRSGLSQSGVPGYASVELPTYEQIFNGLPPSASPKIRFQTFPFS